MKSKHISVLVCLAWVSFGKSIMFQRIFMVLFFALYLGGCTEKDPQPVKALLANAGADQQVKVMETV